MGQSEQETSSTPLDGIAFALVMALAAYLGRANPYFVYPQILWCFLALLSFNLVNFSVLPRLLSDRRRVSATVLVNTLLLSAIVFYSGGKHSYFWVMYLLPIFSSCLAFGRTGILRTSIAISVVLLLFHAGSFRDRLWGEVLEAAVKLATIFASTMVVMRVALRERDARRLLQEEQERLQGERASVREKVQHMDRLATLGTLTASVAHELNTPLTTILGFSQLMQEPSMRLEDLREFGRRVEASVVRCRTIIQDMLSFARSKSGRRRPEDINALVRECVELKRYDWTVAGVSVEESYAADLPEVVVSGAEFQQVLFNLLSNAYQALRSAGIKDGRIRVRTRCWREGVLATVEDNGPGVPADLREKIWEPFFTTKKDGEGTGLGLAISRQIVEGQGGTLALEPDTGFGAAFTIRLPLRPMPEGGAAGDGGEAPRGILIAEDDKSSADLMTRLLVPYRLPVEHVPSFDEALERIRRARPALLIADLHMPGMSAQDFFREVETLGALESTRVLIVSGSFAGAVLEDHFSSKNWPCLPKPFDIESFRLRVTELLQGL